MSNKEEFQKQKILTLHGGKIQILIPNLEDKFNYYHKPSKKLDRFDEISIVFVHEGREFILYEDIVYEGLIQLKGSLLASLHGKASLPENIAIGQLGQHYNNDAFYEFGETNYFDFWLWSIKGVQTWLYTKDGEIYLEIAPSYVYVDAEDDASEQCFKKFMEGYKPIAVEKIEQTKAAAWIEKCDALLEKIDAV